MAGNYNYNVVFERDISTPISTHKTLGIWQSPNSNPYIVGTVMALFINCFPYNFYPCPMVYEQTLWLLHG